MGLKRGLWRSTGVGRTIDTVKNIVDEGSISGGVKRMIKEDLTEDNPLGKMIYESGRYDGKKEGYEEASAEYDCRIMWLIEANSAWSISVRCPLNKLFCVYSVWLYHHLFYILKPTL